jgi:hypothetical protein
MSWMTGDRFLTGAGHFLFIATFRMAPWTINVGVRGEGSDLSVKLSTHLHVVSMLGRSLSPYILIVWCSEHGDLTFYTVKPSFFLRSHQSLSYTNLIEK